MFFNSGLNTSENVLTARQQMLAQQYHRVWLSFSVSGDFRLSTQSRLWRPVATACVTDAAAPGFLQVAYTCISGQSVHESFLSLRLMMWGL